MAAVPVIPALGGNSFGSLRTAINNLIARANAPKVSTYTVATLPSAATVGDGATAIVTDATTPALGATVAGAGAVRVRVNSDGTNWKVG